MTGISKREVDDGTMESQKAQRILVIDDEAEVRQLVHDVLVRASYTVDTSDDPSEIVASLLVGRYDLITIDLKMPEMDGQDVAELAKAVDQKIPVVVISGFLTPDLRRHLEGIGIRHFIAKPFKPSDLLASVRDALSGTPHASP